MGDPITLRSLDNDCCYFLHLEIQGGLLSLAGKLAA